MTLPSTTHGITHLPPLIVNLNQDEDLEISSVFAHGGERVELRLTFLSDELSGAVYYGRKRDAFATGIGVESNWIAGLSMLTEFTKVICLIISNKTK